jgi:hypothetical protein
MIKFVAAPTVAAVTTMQLVRTRDGTTDQKLAEAFEPDDQPVLEAKARHRVRKNRIRKDRWRSPPGSSPASEDGLPTTEPGPKVMREEARRLPARQITPPIC